MFYPNYTFQETILLIVLYPDVLELTNLDQDLKMELNLNPYGKNYHKYFRRQCSDQNALGC